MRPCRFSCQPNLHFPRRETNVALPRSEITMNNSLLPSDLSHGLRSCRIEIVSDNAISPVHSLSELVQPPIQLTPFGSSWMKIGSCPAKVKDRMKLQVTGTRLTKEESRWRASVHERGSSALIPRQDERNCGGSLRKCQSDSNLFSHSSIPKVPVRTMSPKKVTATVTFDSMTSSATWDVMNAPIKPLYHPSVITEELERCGSSSLLHSLHGPPLFSADLGIDTPDCDNLVLESSVCLGLQMPKCTDAVESSASSQKMTGSMNSNRAMRVSFLEPSIGEMTPVYFKGNNLLARQGRFASIKNDPISSCCLPEDESSTSTETTAETFSSAGDSSLTRTSTPTEISVKHGELTTEMVHYPRRNKVLGSMRRVCSVGSSLHTLSVGNADYRSTISNSQRKFQPSFDHHDERKDTNERNLFLQLNDSLTPLHLAFSPLKDECEKDGRKNTYIECT